MQSIQEAIKSLDPENNDNWTVTGLPSVDAVSHAVGGTVTRKQIGEAVPGYDREAARKAAMVSDEGGVVGDGDQDDQSDENPPSPELNAEIADDEKKKLDDDALRENVNHWSKVANDLEVENENLKNENDYLREELEALKYGSQSGLDNDDDPISLIERAVAASKHDRYGRNYALKSYLGAWASNCEEAKQVQKRLDLRNEARNK